MPGRDAEGWSRRACLNDPSVTVRRGGEQSAHAFLAAPYGTYPTADGHIALAMNPLPKLAELLEIDELRAYTEEDAWSKRSAAEELLATRLATAPTEHWLRVLDAADVWCAPVLTLEQRIDRDAALTRDGQSMSLKTTRSPIRVDGRPLVSAMPSPKLGQHDADLREEFGWSDEAPA